MKYREPMSTFDFLHNPYLKGFLMEPSWDMEYRHHLTRKYSFAIPDEGALRLINQYSPDGLIELGAGTGYWAWLLRKIGVKILAFDPSPGCSRKPSKPYGFCRRWTKVFKADHRILPGLVRAEKMALFLCWPDYKKSWAAEALDLYPGKTVIFVGESYGCTGDTRFHDALSNLWKEVKFYTLHNWEGISDCLSVHQRLSK